MITPINPATDGYFCSPLSVASNGYLCNPFYTPPSGADEDHYTRRPNEPVIWCDDDNIRCQEELTKFKAKPEDEQKAIVIEAIETVKRAAPTSESITDAQDVADELQALDDMMCQVECINILLLAYFRVISENRRRQDEVAAMFLLGFL